MSAEVIPTAFVQRMSSLLGSDLDEFLSRLRDPPEGLRVNTLRLRPEKLRQMVPFALEPLGVAPEGFTLDRGVRAGRHPYHAAGLYYLQDPGALAVGAMVDPQPGERVLDLAAAPGGKATHLAARMAGRGLLVANDVSRGRARELSGNLERCGVRNAAVLAESAPRLVEHFGAYFDRVLLDAPCSGESMFHKSTAARVAWSEAAVAGCARRQVELLGAAAELTRPGGLLVYSTCTFSLDENELAVARFLEEHTDFVPVELAAPGHRDIGFGRTGCLGRGTTLPASGARKAAPKCWCRRGGLPRPANVWRAFRPFGRKCSPASVQRPRG
jgi:16S rRNA C967 or C1407 C5-methylase (RsmB/RsmF family)